MKGNRIQKYILYAIGEIILVVIGILLAVSINNWNESRKEGKLLKSYLLTYKQDLETDTLQAGRIIKHLQDREALFNLFLSDTATTNDYSQKPLGYGLTISYVPFEPQKKGLQLLEKHTNTLEQNTDTLVQDILANSSFFNSIFKSTQTRIEEDISDNMSYLKNNKPWLKDLLNNKFTDPELKEFFLSDEYKTKLAVHKSLVIGNLLAYLKLYHTKATQLIDAIEKRLETGAD